MATVTGTKRHLAITSTTYDSSGDVVVGGNLTVEGTTTTLDTANLLVEDKNIIIGNVSTPSDTTADGGGITLKGASDYTINWVNANNRWEFNQGIHSSGPITSAGQITGTELEGTSLDINGNADISGNLGGVDTLTATTLSVTNYGLASGDIPNNAADTSGNAATATVADTLQGFDDRDVAPDDISFSEDLKLFFAEKAGIEGGTVASDYQDLLVLNSYSDSSGGKLNALAFDKSTHRMLHYNANYNSTDWGTPKEIAYKDSDITGNAATATSAGSATTASNAMLLDGIDSTLFVRSDSNDTLQGTYLFSRTNTTPAIDISGHAGAASYNYFLRARNDGGTRVVMFVNGSTRTADGGVNAATIRNDGGFLILGSASHSTKLVGSGNLTYNGDAVLTTAAGTAVSATSASHSEYADAAGTATSAGSATTASNAMLLDGIDSTSFLRSDAADTMTGTLTNTTATAWGTNLKLINTNADASPPILTFLKNGGSPADNDYVGFTNYRMDNSNGDEFSWVELSALAIDVTDGSESSAFRIGTWGDGTEYPNTIMAKSGNVGIGDSIPTSISANTFSLSVNSSRSDLSGGLISKANGSVKHQQYWDSSGYSFNLTAGQGNFKFNGANVGIGTTTPSAKLEVYGSGSTVLDIQGSQGQLFSITDDLTGDLLNISDISGIPIFSVNASGTSSFDGAVEISGNIKEIRVGDNHFIGNDADDNLLITSSINENLIVRAGVGLRFEVDGNATPADLALNIDNAKTSTFGGYVKIPQYLMHDGDTNTRLEFTTGNATLKAATKITMDGPLSAGSGLTVTGAATISSNLSVSGNTALGNGNGDTTHINDILHIGATDSGNSDLYFGEGSTNAIAYGVHWNWDSGYKFSWFTRNNNSDTLLMDYSTNVTTVVNWHRPFSMKSNKITDLATPTATTDAATKAYVDGERDRIGNSLFAASSTSTSYSTAGVEIRESGLSGSGGTPPRLGLHHGGVVASSITIESNGTVAIRNNPGNAYEQFRASTVTADTFAGQTMMLNWKMFHDTTALRTLYKDGKTANFPWAYSNIIMPFKGNLSTISFAHNPFGPYTSAPTGNSAVMRAYVNGTLKETITVSYGSSAGQVISFNFTTATNFNQNDKVSLRFQANGIWRYVTMGILFRERA
mgnify:CR=1 FL=1